MNDLTPETLAELRRLLDEYPKTVGFGFQAVTDAWFALAHAAINALPALLDAAEGRALLAIAHRDILRMATDRADERDEIAGRLAELLGDLTGGRLSKTTYPVPVMVQEVEQYLSECHESDLKDERDELAAALDRVRALHRPVGIYDECECSDEAKAEGHEDVEEVGLTCNRMYTVCAECCRDDVYQTEDCANYHDHKPDEAHHCPTIRALDGGDR